MGLVKSVACIGHHNEQNLAVVKFVADQCAIDPKTSANQIKSFELPPFRCQKVMENDNRMIINDSKSTNMDATLTAVKSFEQVSALILTGQPKGPFTDDWAIEIMQHCDRIYASGYLKKQPLVFQK